MSTFGPLACLLSVVLAGAGGTVLGRRPGLAWALLVGTANVGVCWLTGAWGEMLPGAAAALGAALVVSTGAGVLRERAQRAQSEAQVAAYARESLESEIAELLRSEQGLRARAEQQAVAASISQFALAAPDLPALFEDVVRRVGEALGTDICTLWTCTPEGEPVAQASHTSPLGPSGTDEGPLRHARYTYWVAKPVIVENLRSDPRLRGAPTDGRLTSGVVVPVAAHGAPCALLGVHSTAERAFVSHEVSFLEAVATIVAAAVERRSAEEALERQALHDPLTGLANRSLFQDRLAQALEVARRDQRPLALMLMDLDRFKEINDTLGHQAGDQLLLEVANRLRQVKRGTDTVARLGGDEFALILPAVADLDNARRLAGKLLDAVERPMPLGGQTVDIGASIGVAMYPVHGEDAAELLRRADVAMYVAKRNGEGAAVYTSEQDQHSRGRLALTSALRQAIEAGELTLHFQPQIDLKNGEIGGIEALVRWNHPELGLVEPDTFIPLAEQMGLIVSLDRWALNAALRQARAWQDAGFEVPMAVNLSMRNVLDPNLTQIVGDLLAKWDIPPTRLELEITESSIMADPLKVRAVLAQCRALGVRIAIDDFGTGYSSLAYLKRLPVDTLKIDKSFVSDMAGDKSDLAIVRSTLELGHNLGLRVVAEGVEDDITSRLLSQLKCDLAQGHYFSPALPADELLAWLNGKGARWRRPALRFAA